MLAWLLAAAAAAEPSFPHELTDFRAHSGNPVFVAAGEGHWDARLRERGWVLRDGDRWRLWYTGYDGTREGRKQLGLATSADGLRWDRHPANPLAGGVHVEDVMVVPRDGRLFMFAEGEGDRAELLVSDDGVRWELSGTLDIRATTGDSIPPGPFGTPTAIVKDGVWHLFYERGDLGVWLATSSDLKVWTNVSDEPVLRLGPEPYDAAQIALNQVVEHDGRYYALYHGSDGLDRPKLWTCNLAVSDDLRTWTKYPGNPLFSKRKDRSSNVVVPEPDGRFRLYTTHGRVEAFLPEPDRCPPELFR